jgi:hypothetical protein
MAYTQPDIVEAAVRPISKHNRLVLRRAGLRTPSPADTILSAPDRLLFRVRDAADRRASPFADR